jgi:hypothetical protein
MPSGGNLLVATARLNADTIRICYPGGPPETAGLNIPAVRDFDCITNTLGPLLFNCDAFAALAPQIAGYHRNVVMAEDWIYAATVAPVFFVGQQITLYRHDGVGFLAPIVVSDNVLLPQSKLCCLEAIYMDPAGTAHVIYSERPRVGPQKPRIVYYRQISSAGVMTAPVVVYTYNFISDQTFGFPDRVGTMLIFPFPVENGTSELDQYWTGGMLVVDPYTAPNPAITQVAVPTQRLNAEGTARSGSIHASTLGGQTYLWWVEQTTLDGLTPLSRILFATYSGGPIAAGTIFHDELANPSFDPPGGPIYYLSPPIMDVVDPMLLVGMSGLIGGFPVAGSFYWFSIAGPPGAPAVIPLAGSRRMVVLVPNQFDRCLQEQLKGEQQFMRARTCCQQETWVDIDSVRAPKDFISRRPTGAIPTPLAISGDVEIFNFRVPTGYDGLITALFHDYTGPGFADGNGDIQWRLQVNRTYAIHLGNVLVRLGSRQQAYGLDGGIQIQSGQTLRYIVNVPNLSGGILPMATQIVAGLEILLYARR